MAEKPKSEVAEALWRRVLVPVSFAPSSEEALRVAFDVASPHGDSELFVLRMAHDPIIQIEAGIETFSLPGDWPRESKRRRRQLDHFVAEQLEHARRAPPVTKLITEGDQERRILKTASEKNIDLIALGYYEETGLEHFFIGRNIDRIVDRADCAVMIIRIHLFREESITGADRGRRRIGVSR